MCPQYSKGGEINTRDPLSHIRLAIKFKVWEASSVSKDLENRCWQWEGQLEKLGRICVLQCYLRPCNSGCLLLTDGVTPGQVTSFLRVPVSSSVKWRNKTIFIELLFRIKWPSIQYSDWDSAWLTAFTYWEFKQLVATITGIGGL